MTQDQITELQRRIGPSGLGPARDRRELRRRARWWELEAMRGYASSAKSREYAANLRWLVELLDNGVKIDGVPFERLVREHQRRA